MESLLDLDALDFMLLSIIFLVVLIGFALTDWGLEDESANINIPGKPKSPNREGPVLGRQRVNHRGPEGKKKGERQWPR